MKILLLITDLGVGGAERQVVDLADAFTTRGHEVVLVYLTGPATLRPLNPRIQLVALGMNKGPLGFLRAAVAFSKLNKSFRPDVVHSHLVHANIFARVSRIWITMPVLVSSAHNTNEEGWWRVLGYRITDRLANISTNVSAEAVDVFERHGAVKKGRMGVVYNGISTKKFQFDVVKRRLIRAELGVTENQKLVLAVGRLWPQKDYPNLLKAIALLQSSVPNMTLAIAGDGPLLEELLQLMPVLGVDPNRVSFLGIRGDIVELMSAADVFVLSSAWEGFGLVVAEAMAMQRVVVATDCGGVREVLGDCGFLVPPRNPKKLAHSLLSALELSELESRQIGLAARERIESRYSIDDAAKSWLGLYMHHRSQLDESGENSP